MSFPVQQKVAGQNPETKKVLVLGTSHIGALRAASGEIRSHFPGLDVHYYGLPGKMFFGATRRTDNRFGPDPSDSKVVDLARRINGSDQTDLAPFDKILVVGPRLGLFSFYRFCTETDVQGYSRAGAAQLMSNDCFGELLAAKMAERGAELARVLGNDDRITIAPAPYPGMQLAAKGPDRIGVFARFKALPDAGRLLARFEKAAATGLARYEYGFLPQPAETRATGGGTKQVYSTDAEDFRRPETKFLDHKHMNAAYGLAVFSKYAASLGSGPSEKRQSTNTDTEER